MNTSLYERNHYRVVASTRITSLQTTFLKSDKITGHSCEELAAKYKPANPKNIPPEILATKGKTRNCHFHYSTLAHVTEFTSDDVFNINTPNEGTSSGADQNTKVAGLPSQKKPAAERGH